MTHTLVFSLLAAAAGALAGRPLARLAARRSARQPLGYFPDEERLVLAAVADRPAWFLMLRELDAEHFTDDGRRQAWAAIAEAFAGLDLPAEPLSAEQLDEYTGPLPDGIGDRLAAVAAGCGIDPAPCGARELLEAASKVFDAGLDRTEYIGRVKVEYRPGADPPVVRDVPPPGRFQYGLSSLMAAAGAAAAVVLGKDTGVLAVASLVVLTAGCVIWTLVDLDTLYVDTATFWPLTALAWALTLVALATGGAGLTAGLIGLGCAAAIVALIEGINRVFMALRGMPGMGGGDYLLILATIGVPVAVAGDWVFGYWSLMASMALAIGGWAVARLARPGFDRSSPFAFGPSLAAGWIVTVFVTAVTR